MSNPSKDPTHLKEPTRSDSTTSQPNHFNSWQWVVSSKNRLWQVCFSFPFPKFEKPEPTNVLRFASKNFQILAKHFPNSSKKFQILTNFFQILDIDNISSRFGEISIRSGEISSNPVRFQPNLAKYHQLFTIFSSVSQIFDSKRTAQNLLQGWTARSDWFSIGSRLMATSPYQVGPIVGWVQIRPNGLVDNSNGEYAYQIALVGVSQGKSRHKRSVINFQ